MIRKISCNILTPEKTLYEGEVAFAVVQAHNGELGFLYNHAPLISELGIGEIRLRDENIIEYLVVEGGIVEIMNNRMIILAENAYKKNELNAEEIEKKLKALNENKPKAFSEESIIFTIEHEKLKAQLKVARR